VTHLFFLDTGGYQKQLKIRYGTSDAVTSTNSSGFSKQWIFSGKSTFPGFGVFQQNRPIAELNDSEIDARFSSAFKSRNHL
jgi:hypothetical protein